MRRLNFLIAALVIACTAELPPPSRPAPSRPAPSPRDGGLCALDGKCASATELWQCVLGKQLLWDCAAACPQGLCSVHQGGEDACTCP